MCGIVGIVSLCDSSILSSDLKKMTDSIRHRGPDGEGQWINKNIGLGHRRLAIIDLSDAAAQPMKSEDGRYILVYNGMLYNYKILRGELAQSGSIFRSNSDTEVVLKCLIAWGEKALTKFNGMFAFGFYDLQNKTLLIARDRYGIKPLYYSKTSREFVFASEQKGINQREKYQKTVDTEALIEYLTFQNIFSNRTFDKNISILPPGHFIRVDVHNKTIFEPEEYWDFDFHDPYSHKNNKAYEVEFDRLFQQACDRMLLSDVEVGAYLSGGIDSSSIVHAVSKRSSHMKTFTVGFTAEKHSIGEIGIDEREFARETSALLHTQHFETIINHESLQDSLSSLVHALEEPRVGQSYPNYYAAKLASQHVKVVLTGTGGDELFGGYPWRYSYDNDRNSRDDFLNTYFSNWQRLLNFEELKLLLTPISKDFSGAKNRNIFKSVFDKKVFDHRNIRDCINISLYFEAKTFLHGLLLVEDKLSMAHGLETRLPFLDNDLVEFAMRLPIELKVLGEKKHNPIDENFSGDKKGLFFAENRDGKLLVRTMIQQRLQNNVSVRKKQGFSAPDATWFRFDNRAFIERKLFDYSNPLHEFCDIVFMKKLVNEHFDGIKNRRLLIWSLLYLSEMLESY